MDVHAAVPAGSPLAAALKNAGVPTTAWCARSDLSLTGAARLARIARHVAPDIIHAQDARSHASARLAFLTPLVVTRHIPVVSRSRLKYGGVSRYIAVSHAVRDALATAVPAATICLVPPGVPAPPADERVADRAALGIGAHETVIITVAALTREKGVDAVIRTAALAAKTGITACWLIVGEGAERAALERLAHDLAAPVTFIGWRDDVGALLRAADLMVHLPRIEGFGLAVVEALARGVPVVSACVGGLAEFVTPAVGSLVGTEDPSTIVAAVRRWLTDAPARAAAALAGPTIAARYGVDAMLDGTLAAYALALDAAPSLTSLTSLTSPASPASPTFS